VSVQHDVDVVIALFRPGAWIEGCLASVRAQENVRVRTILVDDDPSDPMAVSLAATMPDALAITTNRNRGYAAANNAGIAAGRAPFVLCLNQDARLAPDYLDRLTALLRANPNVASASGKLLRLPSPTGPADGTVDSLGLAMQPGRRTVDVGQGRLDDGASAGQCEVFGVSAAAGLYRRSALEAVSEDGSVFDEAFFMYKEDVDLAWRLRRAGYIACVDGEAIGYHGRSAGRPSSRDGIAGLLGLWAHERAKSKRVRRLSWRNQMLLIMKNEGVGSVGPALGPMILLQLLHAAADLVLDPIGGLANRVRLVTQIPRALRQRDGRYDVDLSRWLS
jgi:GT2 family glycosyltransferase